MGSVLAASALNMNGAFFRLELMLGNNLARVQVSDYERRNLCCCF
jgi:hypothetical protein